nr:reverse transcriptase domain-containing protein [Tanacetum cinerariifolium]
MGDHQKLQLNELNELRDQAYENSLIYKEKTKEIHDSKIKNRIFNAGPFTITKVFLYGTVELSQTDGPNFKGSSQANVTRLPKTSASWEALYAYPFVFFRIPKTPYELFHDKLPDLSFLHVFGALCYSTNDSENLGKLQPKADIGIFIGYAPTKKALWIYNRRTRRIVETIHVDFDELTDMASEQSSSGPALHEMTPAIISS